MSCYHSNVVQRPLNHNAVITSMSTQEFDQLLENARKLAPILRRQVRNYYRQK